MDDLRLSLLAIGVLVLIGIYIVTARAHKKSSRRQFTLKDRRQSRKQDNISHDVLFDSFEDNDQQVSLDANEPSWEIIDPNADNSETDEYEPTVDFSPEDSGPTADPLDLEQQTASPYVTQPEPPAPNDDIEVPEMVVVFFLMSREGGFAGLDVRDVMDKYDFAEDSSGYFSYHVEDDLDRRKMLFGVANAVEPGSFDFNNMADMSTPGLVAFMQLPGPLPGLDCFDRMVHIVQQMGEYLNAEVHDDKHSVVTLQTLGHLREKVHEHEIRVQLLRQPGLPGRSPGLS